MNTIQLECFVTIAQYLNFSRASEILKITQPAVSHQIRSLEEELGVKLFNRTSKRVSLTSEGIQFLPDAHLILRTAFSARERLGNHDSIITFDIGCHNCLELELFPDVLKDLSAEFPLIHPSIHIIPFPSLFGMIEDKKLHAVLSIKERQTKSALMYEELFRVPFACICTPDHPLAQQESVTKEMLTGNFVACSPQHISNTVFAIWSRILSEIQPHEHYFTNDFESIFTLTKAGFGFTVYPDLPCARQDGLRYVPITDLTSVSFGIYYHHQNDFPALHCFLKLCKKKLAVF